MREGTVVRKAHSADRLLAEVTRILHVPEAGLPEYKRLKLEKLRQVDDELAGCRVLIVDDDVRNIFALTSILERHHIEVMHAENGRAGIDTLLKTPEIDIVLMDIMMPGMDGYETIRAIRELEQLREPADHRRDGQGHEGRPREMHRFRRVRLHCQAGRSGSALLAHARLGA